MRAVLLIAILVVAVSSVHWTGTDANGDEVIRTFRVLKSPAMGFPDTFTILAVQRELEPQPSGKKHKTVSRIEDALEFTFSVVALPHYTIRYYKASTDQVETGAVRHGLRKLIEYVPGVNASAGFQPGQDNKTSEMYFWKGTGSSWSNLQVQTSVDQSTGANQTSVCTSNDVGVTICMYISDLTSQLTVNGSQFKLSPNSIHHTLTISKYPFLRNDTQLCLKTHFEARTRVLPLSNATVLDSNEDALDLSDGNSSGASPIAAWQTTVNVQGNGCSATAPVVRSDLFQTEVSGDVDANITNVLSKLSGEISINLITRYVYFSYLTNCPQPSNIYWDPDVGYVDAQPSSAVSFNAIPSAVIILIIALLAIHF
jgi:hypothetical protein